MPLILGFETSCDETGVAVVRGVEVLANEVASQIDVHKEFGGVVPEIASRQHTRVISQLTGNALRQAGAAPAELDAIAATQGPGLTGSLLVGLCFAKALAFAWSKPFIPVHHIEGHLFSAMFQKPAPDFPFLALVVSGGHTQLVDCPRPHAYHILGKTRDDAVGECFDKAARLLGLPYPGGPSIQRAAEAGDPTRFEFPRAMLDEGALDFSYSGLKTAVLYTLREREKAGPPDEQWMADAAASFQAAAIDALVRKTRQALERTGATRLVLAGGVAANALLRKRLAEEMPAAVFLPPLAYCIDNAAMIAAAADSRFRHGLAGALTANAEAGLPL